MTRRERLALQLAAWLAGRPVALSAAADESAGWRALGRHSHDRAPAEQQQLYVEALQAWRKNPLAWRIVQITTDYTVGEGLRLSSRDPDLQRFIEAFWHHPLNHLPLRLAGMCEELARAGDLFPVLFRQPHDGVSLLRFLTKDQVREIETRARDWELETAVLQHTDDPTQPKRWPTPAAASARTRAVALHYCVNQPLGAAFGESDLATVTPWLLRYSRLLEDRVRLHWSTRMFLWFVQVPNHRVAEKAEQYRTPPEAGSVIVHDESEQWTAQAPVLRGADAAPDLKAVRNMIDAGSGYPPHWRGEAADVNLATAQAMQEPAERHLARRQAYFAWLLQDLTYQAYARAHALHPDLWPALDGRDYRRLFLVTLPDVSRSDNAVLARASADLSLALERAQALYPASPTLRRLLLKLVLRFAGEPQGDDVLDVIAEEG